MKLPKVIGLVVFTTLSIAALAAEVWRAQIPCNGSRQAPQALLVFSGKQMIAEVKIMNPGTLNIEAKDITWFIHSTKKDYNLTGGSKLELLVEGKQVLTVLGEQLSLPDADPHMQSVEKDPKAP
jgi:hypothetical protein